MKQSDKRLIRKAKRKARQLTVAERIQRAERWIAEIERRLGELEAKASAPAQ